MGQRDEIRRLQEAHARTDTKLRDARDEVYMLREKLRKVRRERDEARRERDQALAELASARDDNEQLICDLEEQFSGASKCLS